MILAVNELLQEPGTEKVYRVLWIDEGNVIAYLIDIQERNAMPFVKTIKDLSFLAIVHG